MIIKWHPWCKTSPKSKTLPFGIQMKGEFNTHKHSSRCPHHTLSSKPGLLLWPCCFYLSRTSWSITLKLGWTQMTWRWVSWCMHVSKDIFFFSILLLKDHTFSLKQKAVEVMCFVPKRCNDMMNVGRLQGFEVCLKTTDHSSVSLKHANYSTNETTLLPLPLFVVFIFAVVPG